MRNAEDISALNDMRLPVTNWNITLALQTRDVPRRWLWTVNEWLQQIQPLKGVFSYEVGLQHHAHLQGYLQLRWPCDVYHVGVLKRALEELLTASPADQRRFTVRVLRDAQSLAMIGYCTKDEGKASYLSVRYNVTDEEVALGTLAYQQV